MAITKAELQSWIENNTTLAKTSAYKYSHAINTISNEMIEYGVIPISLFEMSIIQFDKYLPIILKNEAFYKKNKTGNNMYSNALKQYRMFRVAQSEIISEEEVRSEIRGYDTIKETERQALVKSRIGQGKFREQLMKKYDSACIITGITIKKLLIASHIKPWAVSDNHERLSEDNGLLLSPTFDRLFDGGLITFSNNGTLYISSQLNTADIKRLHINSGEKFDLKINRDVMRNLEYHRDVIFYK